MSDPQRPPSQSRGIWALCLTVFGGCCCYIPTIVGTVMAFKVLNKSEWEGTNHGRELAIGALGVAAFHLGTLTLSLVVVLGGDTFNLGSGKYGAEAANADASIVAIWDLATGECFDDPSLRDRRGPLRKVPCEERHDAEVFMLLPLPPGQYPGLPSFRERARDCRVAFAEYVGTPLKDSTLAITFYYPTRASWENPDKPGITCVVLDPRRQLTGSVWQVER